MLQTCTLVWLATLATSLSSNKSPRTGNRSSPAQQAAVFLPARICYPAAQQSKIIFNLTNLFLSALPATAWPSKRSPGMVTHPNSLPDGFRELERCSGQQIIVWLWSSSLCCLTSLTAWVSALWLGNSKHPMTESRFSAGLNYEYE